MFRRQSSGGNRRGKVTTRARVQASSELMEVRQLLAADLSVVLFDATLLDQHDGDSTATQYFAAFSSTIDANEAAAAVGAVSATPFSLIPNSFDFKFDTEITFQQAADRFSGLDSFVYIQPDILLDRSTRLVPNDPLFPSQWHLRNIGQTGGTPGADANVTGVWDNYTGQGVAIGIVDDSLQLAHPDLAPNIVAGASFDWVQNDNDPSPPAGFGGSHGTSVAGVAAARGNNGVGVSGAAPNAGLVGLRLLGANTPANEAAALTHLLQSIHISNNSWGPLDTGVISGIPAQVAAALQNGATTGRGNLGTIYVWAGGNGRQSFDNVNYDAYANSRYTIAVGAIDHNGRQSFYSEPGAPLLVSAYSNGFSSGITTTDTTGNEGYNAAGGADGDPIDPDYTSTFGGTSSAAPLVSGVVALMLEANPNLSYRDVQDILVRSARLTDAADNDWVQNGAGLWVNHKYGFGAIDANAAVARALTHINLGPEITIQSSLVQVNQVIPDNSTTGLSIPVNINGQMNLEHVELVFNAGHFRRGDLEVVLVAPDGTRSVMAQTRTTDTGFNYSNWTFTSARHWGQNPQGIWRVEVRDLRNGVQGTLNSFQLRMYGTELPLVVTSSRSVFGENEGPAAATGTVSRSQFASVANAVEVFLTSSDTTEATVPASVIIPAGQRSATFPINAVDDTLLDGPQPVTIFATLGSFTASTQLTVLDHETITVSIDRSSIYENEGAGAANVTVTRSNTDVFPPNHYVAVNNELRQYDENGVLVSSLPVPWPTGPRPIGENIRDVVVMQNGRISVYNGSTTSYLSVYSPGSNTWQHFSTFGLSTSSSDGGTGGVSAFGEYVYMTDMEDGASNPYGLVRINTTTGDIQRFGTKSFGNRLFANGLFDSRLFELNPVDGSTIQQFSAPVSAAGSAGMAFDGTYVYFLHSGLDSIFKIDPETGFTVDTFVINAGTTSFSGLAYLNGKLYILDPFITDQILEYDPIAREVTNRMFVGAINGLDISGGLAADPTNNVLYVSSTFGDDIYVISPSSGLLQSSFDSGHSFQEGLAVVGDELYLSVFGDENLYVYSLDGAFKRSIPTPAVFGGFYSLGGDGVPGLVDTSFRYRDVAVGLDQVVYALDNLGTTVGKFDPTTLAVLDFLELETPVRAISVAADGTIYGAADSGDVVVFNSLGKIVRSAASGLGVLNDIDLSVTGAILLSNTVGQFAETNTDLTSFDTFITDPNHTFVSFGEYAFTSTSQVLVTLTNSDPTEISIALQVIIPVGVQSVTFPLDAVDDNFRDGTQLVFISASGAGYTSNPDASIAVLDFEGITVDVVEPWVYEDAGPNASLVRISRSDIDGPFDHIAAQNFHVTTPQTILDRDTIISPVVVPSQISRITDVNVTISLQHTWLADLDVFLISPSGTRVELFTDIISNGTLMTNMVLDDQAPFSILTGTVPFTGSYIPEELLGKLNGENPSGTWHLEVTDDNTSDVGTLLSWSLHLQTIGLAEATVTLSSSDQSEATVPSHVVIPANQSEVWVWLDAIDDTLLDGTQTVVISADAVNVSGLDLGSDTIDVLDVEAFTFTVSSGTVSEAAGANALTGRITRLNTDIGSALTVFLHSSDTTELTVPASVQIPAGQTFVEFGISAVDDNDFDGTQTVTIMASAAGYPDQSVQIDVEDLEPSLLLTAPLQTVPENFGILSVTVTRLDQSDISQPMVVTLSSSDLNTLTVPATVTIPANQVFATFNVNVVDNTILQSTRSATITAASTGLENGALTITVTDHEVLTLTLSAYSFLENAGSSAAVATLTRSNSNNSLPLVVTLSSSDLTEVTLPATVTIPAGQSSVTFNVTAVNDPEIDGPQFVTLSAVADGYVAASVVVTVLDHEPPVITGPASPTPSPQPTITWNAIPGATRYEIWVNNLSSGQGQIILRDDISTATPFFTPVDPLGIGVYRVWVRAYDALEIPGFWSSAYNFTVNTAPVILTPAGNGGQAASSMPVLSWTAVGDAQFYDLWIDNATTGQSQVIRRSNLTTTSFVPPTALTTGNYKMWVRGINSKGEAGLWSNERRFTVLSTPTATSPVGGTFNPNPTFTWSAVVGATHYDLWVSNTSTGAIQLRDQFVNGTSFTAPNDLPAGSYTFWVRAFSNTTFSDWSAPRSFGIATAPTITSPTANGITSATPQFIWSSVTGTVRYELWVDRIVSGGSTRVIHQTTLTSPNYTQPTNLAAGSYRVWVRAISSMGTATPWSTPVSFSIASIEAVPSSDNPDLNGHQQLLTSLDLLQSVEQPAVVRATATRSDSENTADLQQGTTSSTELPQWSLPAEEPDAELYDVIMADWDHADWWKHESQG